jgi:hypothetical protein
MYQISDDLLVVDCVIEMMIANSLGAAGTSGFSLALQMKKCSYGEEKKTHISNETMIS